jgi:hypothetical protein
MTEYWLTAVVEIMDEREIARTECNPKNIKWQDINEVKSLENDLRSFLQKSHYQIILF